MKKWQILSQNTEHKKLNTDEIIKVLLANRGLKTKKEIEEFLNPPRPETLTAQAVGIKTDQLQKAVKRIKQAITDKESIIVYSDYDADGVCGAAILWETLNSLGAKVMPYIPDRVEEGYGLSQKGIDSVKKEYGATLIITIDHGITAVEKVAYAKKLGIDVIIADHHVFPKKLPQALAIVHTLQLCGTGVAWFLSRHLSSKIDDLTSKLDLAAMATIADMVPLTGANRILVKYGLRELRKTKRLGLEALIKEAQINKEEIGVYEVSHVLAPRINAMGRLEHAMDSLRLLCTRDATRARDLARHLNETNRTRQELMEQTLEHAKAKLAVDGVATDKLIFIVHESYQQGVIGLVAGKLVEEFYKPAIVVWRGEVFSKASARSVNGFNIIETIRKAQDLLIDAGGHPMAAGFTVETKNLKILQEKLMGIANRELDEEKLTRVLKIDCELELSNLTQEFYDGLEKFKPYGLGNPEPVFMSRGISVKDARIVGADGKHLKLLITNSHISYPIPAVAFGQGQLFARLSPDKPVDIVYVLSLNEWNNHHNLELKIKDIKLT